MFTQAESVFVEPASEVVNYSLLVAGPEYRLFDAQGQQVLSDRLRDYRSFVGNLDLLFDRGEA